MLGYGAKLIKMNSINLELYWNPLRWLRIRPFTLREDFSIKKTANFLSKMTKMKLNKNIGFITRMNRWNSTPQDIFVGKIITLHPFTSYLRWFRTCFNGSWRTLRMLSSSIVILVKAGLVQLRPVFYFIVVCSTI